MANPGARCKLQALNQAYSTQPGCTCVCAERRFEEPSMLLSRLSGGQTIERPDTQVHTPSRPSLLVITGRAGSGACVEQLWFCLQRVRREFAESLHRVYRKSTESRTEDKGHETRDGHAHDGAHRLQRVRSLHGITACTGQQLP